MTVPRPWPIWMAASLVGYALFLFAPPVLNDGDTFWHIVTGDWIISHHAVPHTDPFSFTFAGAPWVAHEWLSELLMGWAFGLGGWSGLLILFGTATALTLGLLARHLARWLEPLGATLVLIIGVACLSRSLLVRPHVLALPVMELWTASLILARAPMQSHARVPWAVLPLMTLWANLHGSFVFGLALIGPFALEALIASGGEWCRVAVRWGLFSLAAIALATITPQGWHGLVFPFQLMRMTSLGNIGEWRSPDFQTLQPMEIALMAAMYVCMSRGVRLPMMRLLILMGLVHLALQHTRHQMLLGIVGALIFAEALGRIYSAIPAGKPATAGRSRRLGAIALGLAGLLTAARLIHPASRDNGPVSPISAVAQVPAAVAAQPVLNDYAFGGYLIFAGIRPFIDGRADLYGDRFLQDYGAMMRPDRRRIEGALARYGIQWTLLAAGSPAVEVMDELPGWRRLYADAFAVVHVRELTAAR